MFNSTRSGWVWRVPPLRWRVPPLMQAVPADDVIIGRRGPPVDCTEIDRNTLLRRV